MSPNWPFISELNRGLQRGRGTGFERVDGSPTLRLLVSLFAMLAIVAFSPAKSDNAASFRLTR